MASYDERANLVVRGPIVPPLLPGWWIQRGELEYTWISYQAALEVETTA